MNGLGLCMFTMLTGGLPWPDLLERATGWDITSRPAACGERIQNLRAAFNRREGIKPADFEPHPRMLGEGDGHLTPARCAGVRCRSAAQATTTTWRWGGTRRRATSRSARRGARADRLLEGYLDA